MTTKKTNDTKAERHYLKIAANVLSQGDIFTQPWGSTQGEVAAKNDVAERQYVPVASVA